MVVILSSVRCELFPEETFLLHTLLIAEILRSASWMLIDHTLRFFVFLLLEAQNSWNLKDRRFYKAAFMETGPHGSECNVSSLAEELSHS